jgi:hypothetical protein
VRTAVTAAAEAIGSGTGSCCETHALVFCSSHLQEDSSVCSMHNWCPHAAQHPLIAAWLSTLQVPIVPCLYALQ